MPKHAKAVKVKGKLAKGPSSLSSSPRLSPRRARRADPTSSSRQPSLVSKPSPPSAHTKSALAKPRRTATRPSRPRSSLEELGQEEQAQPRRPRSAGSAGRAPPSTAQQHRRASRAQSTAGRRRGATACSRSAAASASFSSARVRPALLLVDEHACAPLHVSVNERLTLR